MHELCGDVSKFPFLFGGTFIEAYEGSMWDGSSKNFPSFSEGLSLRAYSLSLPCASQGFPFLFGGAFIEGRWSFTATDTLSAFPFLFGGAFIEGTAFTALEGLDGFGFPFLFGGAFIEGKEEERVKIPVSHFPSFSEGLSLRVRITHFIHLGHWISLPFRRGFH